LSRRPARSRKAPREDPETGALSVPRPPRRSRTQGRLALAVGLLLSLHVALAVRSLVQENPTIDEVVHLPAGITYWQKGTFRLYHHNPPLVKLIAALPVLAAGVEMEPLYRGRYWREEPPNKAGFAHEFALIHAQDYFELFTRARLVMPLFSLVGGLVVFAWSRALYGAAGGLLSLSLWVLCPNVLAHTRLVTTDMGATSLGVLATFLYWRFLREPKWGRAVQAGLALGLALLAKYSLVLLLGLWPALGLLAFWIETRGRTLEGRPIVRGVAQGAAILAVAVCVLDVGYGFERVGRPLGEFAFVCRSLTRPAPDGTPRPRSAEPLRDALLQHRVNRFRGTVFGGLPVPMPAEYLLGFDDQKMEAEGIPRRMLPNFDGDDGDRVEGYPVYLDGVLSPKSWWYYYLFAIAYKVPEGTWILVASSMLVVAFSRRPLASWFDEATLLAIPFAILFVMSVFTNINLGLRYVLPAFPYLFIAAGKLLPWAVGMGGRWRRGLALGWIAAGLTATLAATISIHPHYLAYFNAASGGPARGSEHLIDSNLDWGQDLVGLRRWLARNAPGERVGLAYFGQINPLLFEARPGEAFEWFLPPARPGSIEPLPANDRSGPRPTRIRPGLYVVSASLVRGLPWRVYDNNRWGPYSAGLEAFGYFRGVRPVAQIGYSLFVYRIDAADAARLAPVWGPDDSSSG
jgi:4-amino-4-deoxy-L-arabinose transferase-like glycosyltransferase